MGLFQKKDENLWLIAGLGNPGSKYEWTRHNAGFLAADTLPASMGPDKLKFEGSYREIRAGGKRILILKPLTYMNNSGRCVTAFMNYFKIPPERTIILFDDISLAVGALRLRRNGTHGGHNGMRDIIELAGSEDFPRVKIGIGGKPHPDMDLADHVLSKFTAEEKKLLLPALRDAGEAALLIVKGEMDTAMNRFN